MHMRRRAEEPGMHHLRKCFDPLDQARATAAQQRVAIECPERHGAGPAPFRMRRQFPRRRQGIVEAQAEGSIIFGLTAALWGEINLDKGRVTEQNFDSYRLMRMNEAPTIEIHLLDSSEKPGGMGEPAVALVAPAVCNAIYAATRKRIRALPIAKQGFTV